MKDRSGSTYVVLPGVPSGLGRRVVLSLLSFFLHHPFQLLLALKLGNKRASVSDEVLLDLVMLEVRSFLEETLRKDLRCRLVPFMRQGPGQMETEISLRARVTRGTIEAVRFLPSHVAVQGIFWLLP